MKIFAQLLAVWLLFAALQISAQPAKNIYDPNADAKKDIRDAVKKASDEKKHVLVQIGGNWCPWCIKLHEFCDGDKEIDSLLKADYILVKLNYSKENPNLAILEDYGFPQRFGFPVLLVLDGSGKRLHTQDTGYLELGKSYDRKKIVTFLKNWSAGALNPELYKE
jgi:thioredoxin-related protein